MPFALVLSTNNESALSRSRSPPTRSGHTTPVAQVGDASTPTLQIRRLANPDGHAARFKVSKITLALPDIKCTEYVPLYLRKCFVFYFFLFLKFPLTEPFQLLPEALRY